MAWAVAALVADAPVEIERWESVAVSYPTFAEHLATLAGATSG
jgi:5-enolpyruvylshikimate-3-phosphate synthase